MIDENSLVDQHNLPLELEASDLSTLPFELFHMGDRTVLIIRRHFNDSNVQLMHFCLQGLLYFRNLKCVVEFWEPIYHDTGYRLLIDFISTVREQGGLIGVVVEDAQYYALLQSKLDYGVFRSYKAIEW